MFKIELKINGKETKIENLEDELMKATLESVVTSIKKKVGASRCKEHGKAPEIKIIGKGGKLSIKIEGCCDTFVEQVRKMIN